MTYKTAKREEVLIQQELANLKAKFPCWDFGYELNHTLTAVVNVIKEVIKKVKVQFPKYKFSISKNPSGCMVVLNITPIDKLETFAYYGGDSSGFIVDNRDYYNITNTFVNNSDISWCKIGVNNFITNARTMTLEFGGNYLLD